MNNKLTGQTGHNILVPFFWCTCTRTLSSACRLAHNHRVPNKLRGECQGRLYINVPDLKEKLTLVPSNEEIKSYLVGLESTPTPLAPLLQVTLSLSSVTSCCCADMAFLYMLVNC